MDLNSAIESSLREQYGMRALRIDRYVERAPTLALKVEATNGDGQPIQLCVKRNHAQTPEDKLHFQNDVMKAMHGRGFDLIPQMVPGKSGNLSFPVGDETFIVSHFVDADPYVNWMTDGATDIQTFNAGKVLAQFHQISFEARADLPAYEGPHRRRPVRSLWNAYQYTLLKAENFNDAEAFSTFLKKRARFDDFFAEMKTAPPQRSTAAYIHGDYHPGNILFAGNEVRGIVDFDYLAYGPRLYDIAYSLTMFAYNGPADSDEQFIAGYNNHAKVSIDLEHPDLLKYRRVASLLNIAWLVNHLEPMGDSDEDVKRALAKAELMLSRIS